MQSALVPLEPHLGHLETPPRLAIEEARALVRRVHSASPGSVEEAEASAGLASLYFVHGLPQAAASWYEVATRRVPERYDWHYLKGVSYADAADLESSRSSFDTALSLQPGDLPTLLRRGRVGLDVGDTDDASVYYQRAVAAFPHSAAAQYGLGLAVSERDPEQAIEFFSRALALDASADAIHHSLGMAFRAVGDLEQARDQLSLAGTQRPNFDDPLVRDLSELMSGSRAHLVQAAMARSNQDLNSALRHLERAVAIDPENSRALHNLGALLGELQRPAEGLPYLQRAAVLRPADADLQLDLGTAFAALGRLQESLAVFETALRHHPNHSEAQRRRAAVAAALSGASTE